MPAIKPQHLRFAEMLWDDKEHTPRQERCGYTLSYAIALTYHLEKPPTACFTDVAKTKGIPERTPIESYDTHLISVLVEFLHHTRLSDTLVLAHVDEDLDARLQHLRFDHEPRLG